MEAYRSRQEGQNAAVGPLCCSVFGSVVRAVVEEVVDGVMLQVMECRSCCSGSEAGYMRCQATPDVCCSCSLALNWERSVLCEYKQRKVHTDRA